MTATPSAPAAMPVRGPAWPLYASLALVWLATRAFAIVSIDMTPWLLDSMGVYQGWLPALRQPAFPVDDPTWQYPPGAGVVLLAPDWLSIDYRWSFALVILAFDAVILAVLMLAHARQPATSWRGVALWAMAGVIVGPIMLTRFDLAPTLFAVAAVLLAAQPVRSGALAAIGAIVKVWPALMILALPKRGAGRGIVAFVVTGAAVLLGLIFVFDNGLSFLGNQRDRGLQVESTGALPYLLHSITGGDVAFGFTYGSIQVLMNGAELVGTIVSVTGFVVLGLMAWWRWRGRLDEVPAGDVALTAILVSVATSRVYSPQFNTWLIGIAAAAMLASGSRLRRVAVILIAVSLVTQIVYPWSATQLVTGEPLIVGVQSVRIILLLSATVLSLVAISRRTAGQQTSV
jgi:hypothetical protein